MGEQFCGKLIMETFDGRKVEFENARIDCISENIEEDYLIDEDYKRYEFKSYEIESTIGNISRKRFIKLLMGNGMQRNEAIEIANYIHRKYGYYNSMYLMLI